jgi:putative transposase
MQHYYLSPEAHWKRVRTTNVIERALREVRRRTRTMSSFSNTESCDRIIYGVISHLNSGKEYPSLNLHTLLDGFPP